MAAQPPSIRAQVVMATPSFTLSEEYDDNILLSRQARSDFITAARPALHVEVREFPLTLSLGARLRAELFARHEDLNNTDNWGGEASVAYVPTPTFRLSLTDTFVSTLDPGTIDPETGVITGRFTSTRNTVSPATSYEHDRFTRMGLRYSFTTFRSEAPLFRDSDTHEAEASLERQFFARDVATFHYGFNRFDVEGSGRQDFHFPRVGVRHGFSPTLRLSVEVGPIFLEQPDGSTETSGGGTVRLDGEFQRGSLSLAYERGVHLAGRVGAAGFSQALTATGTLQATRDLSVGLATFAREIQAPGPDLQVYSAEIQLGYLPPIRSLAVTLDGTVKDTAGAVDFRRYSVALRVTYRLLRWLTVEGGYRFTEQNDRSGPLDLSRNVIFLGITASDQFRVR